MSHLVNPGADQSAGSAEAARKPMPASLSTLSLPVIAAPMFIVGNPKLVIAQCCAGIVGNSRFVRRR